MIYQWRREYETGESSILGQEVDHLSDEQKEFERIKLENANLHMELDIPYKAIDIFSKKNG